MIGSWNGLKLQAKFALIVGTGILALGAATVTVIGYLEYSAVEQKLQTFSARELNSLNSLVDSAMRMRLNDPQNVAIKVFDGWFDSRNKEYDGKLWSVWGPSITAYMARTAPKQTPKVALDAIDQEVMRTGRPVGRFVGNTYRYSIPIVWGTSKVTKQEVCSGCHSGGMGAKDGDVIAVFSSSVPTIKDFALLREHVLLMSAGALAAILAMILAVWSVFGRVVAQPFSALVGPLEHIANGDFAIGIPGLGRKDEIGKIAGAVSQMADRISTTIAEVKVSGREVTNASAEISVSTTDLSQRTEEQAASLEETSAAMEEISVNRQEKCRERARGQSVGCDARAWCAERGGEVVAQAVEAMAKIEDSSRKIADIIGVIDEIARQTNLLGAQRRGGSRARRRSGPRLRGGGLGGAQPGATLIAGRQRHQGPDHQFQRPGQRRSRTGQPGRRVAQRDRQIDQESGRLSLPRSPMPAPSRRPASSRSTRR